MGRLWGVVVLTPALGLLVVPGAGAAPGSASPAAELPPPTCAEGPAREGEVIVGTPCADHIVVPPTVTYVDGGPGDDVIEGSRTTAASSGVTAASGSCEVECHLEVGSQTFEGGAGDDIVYGDRGNDILRGNAGDDRLYGGIGDDRLEGGPGNDRLSGGFGADTIDGQEGNDYVRGDGTIDHIFDTGGGADTLSFATGVTPGFGAGKAPAVTGFPKGEEGERGVFVNLGAGGLDADNGIAASAGGFDEVQPGVFERIVGSPFSDYIVGTSASEEIIGGGGADVIQGGGGADVLRGGADGDYLEAGPGSQMFGESGSEPSKDKVDFCTGGGTEIGCGSSTAAVVPRPTGEVSVGETAAGSGATDVYVVGSSGADTVTATYTGAAVEVALSGASFNLTEADAGGCAVSATHATCPLAAPATPNVPALDALLLAGMAGDDAIATVGFPTGATVVGLGGAGTDTLTGGPSEDVLVDGPPTDAGADALRAGPGDDALLHNGGADLLDGGEGSDLFLSVSICDGETIAGGVPLANDRDNASWARFGGGGVDARLDQGVVGEVGAGEAPTCAGGGSFDRLEGIEDLEGSEGSDVLYGDAGVNQLLGHRGEDTYRALGGNDTLFANSGTRDRVIDCGEGSEDSAVIDLAAIGDPAPIGCERVREGTAEEFQTEIEQPVPAPVTVPPPAATQPPPAPPNPKPDRTPPHTKLLRHPAKLIRVAPHHAAAGAFRFAADERSRFECKLDARPYRRCHSPLRARLRPGRHAFRVFAIDAAGNRDRTPALFRFAVVARAHRR
ncbi:MAG TPA: calcium-binding protein [Solirubrobacterales bacterium]|jgi:Ca2+-binding RTX toxin-like protein